MKLSVSLFSGLQFDMTEHDFPSLVVFSMSFRIHLAALNAILPEGV